MAKSLIDLSNLSQTSSELAKRQLERVVRSLQREHPGAAASLREGLDETLTVIGMKISATLRRPLSTTNPIENVNGAIERYTRNVKRWRGGEMIQRWACAALLDAEARFRRIRGYRDMPALIAAIDSFSEDQRLDQKIV